MKILELFKEKVVDNRNVIKPYIIAEAGVNHEGNIDIAQKLIEEALEGGANAIKFQTYKASTISVKNSPAYWDITKENTDSQFKLFSKYDKFWKNEYELLKNKCDVIGIEFMSTPFDLESSIFLNDLMDVFKISSSDITNRPFIEHLVKFNKPIILSTGASNMVEIKEAVNWIDGKVPLALLHCILNYPTDDANANLGMILDLQKNFPNNLIGYSDHTLPNDMSILLTATILGSSIIEKHFTHDKKLKGNDHYHSMDKDDLKKFLSMVNQMIKTIGLNKKQAIKTENISRENARRSLVSNCEIPENSIIKMNHLTWKRPGHGISPKEFNNIIGKKVKRKIKKDQILFWEDFL